MLSGKSGEWKFVYVFDRFLVRMNIDSYNEGDFIVINDRQKANATISMTGDIEEGIIIRIKQKRGDMLVCEKEKPDEPAQVKPFPPKSGDSFLFQVSDSIEQARPEKKVIESDSKDVTSDVADFLSEDRDSKSDSLR